MFEKVNPSHPDKLADRIAGALVDLAYKQAKDPRIAVEVLIGHGTCHIIAETSVSLDEEDVAAAAFRIAGPQLNEVDYHEVPQDVHLSANQEKKIRCGDNGIFKGVPTTAEERELSALAKDLYDRYPFDGKFILNGTRLIVCQSNATCPELYDDLLDLGAGGYPMEINPLGYWTGGPDVVGSDMAGSVTGGGLHGKDLSKADVSVNIYAWLEAQITHRPVELCCAIGDEKVNGIPYADIVEIARSYIKKVGGFEKFAEWGLV